MRTFRKRKATGIGLDKIDRAMLDAVELDRELSKRKLYNFFKIAWPVVDPASFVDGWHLGCICEHLQALYTGEIKNIVINIPPRHCKSTLCAVMFPAWIWTQDSSSRFFTFSYAHELALRDAVKCRRLVESEWYQQRWGALSTLPKEQQTILVSDQNQKRRYETTNNGSRVSSSVGGAVTGEGGDFLICDDPHNVKEAESDTVRENTLRWWKESVSTRMNDVKTGRKLIIQQRVHERDLAGYCLEEAGYYPLVLPAEYEPDHPFLYTGDIRKELNEILWEEKFDRTSLNILKKELGSYAVAGQLQQRPSPRGGGLFKREWLQVLPREKVPSGIKAVRGWDLAGTDSNPSESAGPAYTAGVLIGYYMDKIYILDCASFRMSPGKLEMAIEAILQRDFQRKDVEVLLQSFPQDPGQAGKAQARNYINRFRQYPIRFSPETGSKETRALPLAARAEIGDVYIVKGDWNDRYIQEATTFPRGRYKDQIDASSRGYAELVTIMGMDTIEESLGSTIPIAHPNYADVVIRDYDEVESYEVSRSNGSRGNKRNKDLVGAPIWRM